MNKVILCGRLTRDPEVRYSATERQMAIARYTLAVDRRNGRKDDEQTADFIQCVAFDRAAEFAEKYLRQGMKMIVVGHIQTGSYTNKDGQRVFTTEVIIEDQEFAESKNVQGGVSTTPAPAAPTDSAAPAAPAAPTAGKKKPSKKTRQEEPEEFMEIPEAGDEGLPFDFEGIN